MQQINWPFVTFCAGLVLHLAVAVMFAATGHQDLAWLIAYPGVGFYVLGVILWTATVSSRRRWPDLPFADRLAKLLTFER